MDAPTQPRIFIYLRLRDGERELVRTKIREYRALGTLLADLTGKFLGGEVKQPESPQDLIFEYMDANSDVALVQLCSGDKALLISGVIPEDYRPRMLAENSSEGGIAIDHFIDRAGADLKDPEREELAGLLAQPSVPLMTMIRMAIQPDGSFQIRLPVPD